MAEIYSLKITGVYDDGTGRLVQGEMPFVLAPGCCLCGAVCMETPPCEFCGQNYCAGCIPCRALSAKASQRGAAVLQRRRSLRRARLQVPSASRHRR